MLHYLALIWYILFCMADWIRTAANSLLNKRTRWFRSAIKYLVLLHAHRLLFFDGWLVDVGVNDLLDDAVDDAVRFVVGWLNDDVFNSSIARQRLYLDVVTIVVIITVAGPLVRFLLRLVVLGVNDLVDDVVDDVVRFFDVGGLRLLDLAGRLVLGLAVLASRTLMMMRMLVQRLSTFV